MYTAGYISYNVALVTQKMNYHCLSVSMQSYSGGGGLSLPVLSKNSVDVKCPHLECQKERVINVTFCCYADKQEKNIISN